MSNVRPFHMKAITRATPSRAPRVSERISSLSGRMAVLPRVERRLRTARATRPSEVGAPPATCQEGELSFHPRFGSLVKQRPQTSAFGHARCFMLEPTATTSASRFAQRKARRSSSGARQLVSKRVAGQRSWCRPPRPNPSIEGMPKRLRLLCTPHVKR
jgi:hypothetical protein